MFADMNTMSCRAVHHATITTAARLIDSICQAELRTKILISDNMEPGGAIVHCSRVGGEQCQNVTPKGLEVLFVGYFTFLLYEGSKRKTFYPNIK